MNDQQARQAALDVQRSLAVAAPAGSGKTSLLVQRLLRLLACCQRPEEVLAITFTRKAANEMRERILQALQDARDKVPVLQAHQQALREDALAALQRDSELGWNLLQNPARLKLQTFDSLCRYLARRMALETGTIPPGDQAENCMEDYREAVRALLTVAEKSPLADSIEALSVQFDGHYDQLVEQFAELLASRADWLELVLQQGLQQDRLQQNLRQLVQAQLASLQQSLQSSGLLQELQTLLDYSISHRQQLPADWIGLPLTGDAALCDSQLARWQLLAGLLLTQTGVRQKIDRGIGFPTAKDGGDDKRKQQLKAVLEQLQSLPQVQQELRRVMALPRLESGTDGLNMLAHLSRFLPMLAAQLQVNFQQAQRIDFLGVAIYALQALGTEEQPTNLALRLDYRFKHILVDEFQDTSALQVQMLERLVAGWQPGDGRTLFLVGDPMQSIYEFRRARVGLFIRARQSGLGGIPLESVDLSCNFRSEPAVVDWINRHFLTIFPEQDDPFRGQVRYRSSTAAKTERQPGEIFVCGYAQRQLEMQSIVDSIASQVAQGETDIAVLARKRSHLELLAPLLKQRGIAFQARDVQRLNQCQHVLDLHSLVRALHCGADRIAWLALLRSPVAGLNNEDLWYLTGSDDPELLSQSIWCRICQHRDIEGISADGQLILSRLEDALVQAMTQLGRMNLQDLVEQLWARLGGWQSLLREAHAQDLEDYLELLEKHARHGWVGNLDTLEDDLGRLYSRPVGNEAVPVRLMTIHAAKGLEFGRVYLPCLDSGSQNSSSPALVWQDRLTANGERHFYAACKPQRGETDELYHFLWEEEKTRRQDELSRLLYVGCTRAIQGLHLSGTLKYDEEKAQWRAPRKGSLLQLIWPALQDELTPDDLPNNSEAQQEIPLLTGIRRLNPSRTDLAAVSSPPPTRDHAPMLPSLQANITQRAVGDLLHRSLQRKVEQNLDWNSQALRSSWEISLRARGLGEDRLPQALRQLEDAWNAMANSPTADWLTDSGHTESACELEFARLNADGSVRKLVVDRTFIFQDTRWIIDYKSASPAGGETLEHFLGREVARHREQLRAYAALFATHSAIRTALYFPMLDRLEELH